LRAASKPRLSHLAGIPNPYQGQDFFLYRGWDVFVFVPKMSRLYYVFVFLVVQLPDQTILPRDLYTAHEWKAIGL
jgi:hypothetical protein